MKLLVRGALSSLIYGYSLLRMHLSKRSWKCAWAFTAWIIIHNITALINKKWNLISYCNSVMCYCPTLNISLHLSIVHNIKTTFPILWRFASCRQKKLWPIKVCTQRDAGSGSFRTGLSIRPTNARSGWNLGNLPFWETSVIGNAIPMRGCTWSALVFGVWWSVWGIHINARKVCQQNNAL